MDELEFLCPGERDKAKSTRLVLLTCSFPVDLRFGPNLKLPGPRTS